MPAVPLRSPPYRTERRAITYRRARPITRVPLPRTDRLRLLETLPDSDETALPTAKRLLVEDPFRQMPAHPLPRRILRRGMVHLGRRRIHGLIPREFAVTSVLPDSIQKTTERHAWRIRERVRSQMVLGRRLGTDRHGERAKW